MAGRDWGEVCAYCGEAVLTGAERPEHAIPAALGAGLVVYAVCNPCNEWAGKSVDQPFLSDDWILLLRAMHDVRDPRHRDRRVRNPLGRGFTAEGVYVVADENWKPRITGRIFEDSGAGEYRIVARDMQELKKLTDRVIQRAQERGQTANPGQPHERTSSTARSRHPHDATVGLAPRVGQGRARVRLGCLP